MAEDDSGEIKELPVEEIEAKPAESSAGDVSDEKPKPKQIKVKSKSSKLKRLWRKYQARKKITIPLTVLLVILLLLAVPYSRYKVLGLFMKQNFAVEVIDSQTGKPVTGAQVKLSGKTAETDNQGKASVKVPLGKKNIEVTKKYYKDTNQKVLVGLKKAKTPPQIKMEATGRQVPVTITNKITGKGVENVTIKAADAEFKTDSEGTATLVLPTDKETYAATLSAKDYNDKAITVKVTDQEVDENKFVIVPAGKLYFLSKASGKIDVVKTDLDGSNRQTVIKGTGKEVESDTVLLASRDWKYLVLKSKRDSTQPKLYLIETATDTLTTIDEGDATFNLTGWAEHYFVYTVGRNSVQFWQPKQSAIKGYNAENKHLAILDETTADGTGQFDYAAEYFGDVFAIRSTIIYEKNWNGSYLSTDRMNDKQAKIISIQADGSKKATLKSSGVPSGTTTSLISFEGRVYEANGIYFKYSLDDSFYKYENGQLTSTADVSVNTFYSEHYPTFLLSPSGNQTFWSEPRDGKNTLFVGDQSGEHGKQTASLSELTPYGWYSDNYLLVSKNGSELYILGAAGGQTLKVSDYHKPALNFNGYGGGYGGF